MSLEIVILIGFAFYLVEGVYEAQGWERDWPGECSGRWAVERVRPVLSGGQEGRQVFRSEFGNVKQTNSLNV